MPPSAELTAAHIEAQTRLQQIVAERLGAVWQNLPSYDEPTVQPWLAVAVPFVLGAARQSALLTAAFLAQSIDRPVVDVDLQRVVEGIRGDVKPQEVYRRPFVTVWSELKAGTDYEDAVTKALHRVESAAATDVQLAMTHALRDIGERESTILGYRRVPDPDACPLCKLAAGRRYLTGVLMEIHPRCRCSVSVVTEENRGDFFGKKGNDLAVTPGSEVIRIIPHGESRDAPSVGVVTHGELGPLLVNADHNFLTEDLALAR